MTRATGLAAQGPVSATAPALATVAMGEAPLTAAMGPGDMGVVAVVAMGVAAVAMGVVVGAMGVGMGAAGAVTPHLPGVDTLLRPGAGAIPDSRSVMSYT